MELETARQGYLAIILLAIPSAIGCFVHLSYASMESCFVTSLVLFKFQCHFLQVAMMKLLRWKHPREVARELPKHDELKQVKLCKHTLKCA